MAQAITGIGGIWMRSISSIGAQLRHPIATAVVGFYPPLYPLAYYFYVSIDVEMIATGDVEILENKCSHKA